MDAFFVLQNPNHALIIVGEFLQELFCPQVRHLTSYGRTEICVLYFSG